MERGRHIRIASWSTGRQLLSSLRLVFARKRGRHSLFLFCTARHVVTLFCLRPRIVDATCGTSNSSAPRSAGNASIAVTVILGVEFLSSPSTNGCVLRQICALRKHQCATHLWQFLTMSEAHLPRSVRGLVHLHRGTGLSSILVIPCLRCPH